jgi:hypothetical protein
VSAVSLKKAAAELGVTTQTLSRWLREGAPTVQPGEVGRGRGALVEVEALKRWRAGISPMAEGIPIETIVKAISNCYSRAPEGHSQPAWAEIGLSHRQAAALLVEMYREIVRTATGKYPDTLPAQIEPIFSIFVESARPSKNLEKT